MRIASPRGRIAARAACLAALATIGLLAVGQASAQNGYMMYGGMPNAQQGYMMYGGMPTSAQQGYLMYGSVPMPPNGNMMYAPQMAQNSQVSYAEQAEGGETADGQAEGGQPGCACQGQCGGNCAGDRRCGCHRQRRRSLLETDYWDGRRKCNDCPYGMDEYGQCSDPKWEVTGAAMYMSRTDPRKGVILGNNMGQVVYSTSDLEGDWELGPRLTATRRFENFDFESIFWAIEDWDANATFVNNGLVVGVNGFNGAGIDTRAVNVSYRHRLYNAEGNLKVRWGEAVNILFGGRVMEYHERLNVQGVGMDLSPNSFAEAANYLYGFQMGADTDVPAWFGIKFNVYLKAGVYNNHIREFWGTRRGLVATSGAFTDEQIAFVGETGCNVTWQFHKNIGVFGGYEWMFIDGVVQAPDMLTQAVLRTNTPIYQGAMLGVNCQW